MPEVFRTLGYIFFFYSNDHLPVHIHVKGKGGSARYELEPEIRLTDSKGLKTKELRQIEKLISQRRGQLVAAWHQYFKEKN
ncbi:DUF4160 domain-containing protein [Catalinimonas niigatensis]|uniref:DUF4160 domain-containing protein n=1 Tax=Catalinimonas niigatensis TaxID=1397264 RepID=UPI0026650CF0|nr:DUF4160 domain-containing protein [Catalinimonas niigatensis]WPP49651.1 DUF4160 domain-containing protein [Catalinimonas niigatensis]